VVQRRYLRNLSSDSRRLKILRAMNFMYLHPGIFGPCRIGRVLRYTAKSFPGRVASRRPLGWVLNAGSLDHGSE